MKSILSCATLLLLVLSIAPAQKFPGLAVNGRHLYTPCGDKIVLRGVNKMIVWTGDLALRKQSYAEIRKTKANCVRIVWLANPGPNEIDAGPAGLDRTIQDCIDANMIPMVELHDATGDFAGLQACVDYWKRPDVVAVVQKHEKYLLVNIANECGNDQVSLAEFKSGYENAVAALRAAGIHTPLVIDGSDWGKDLGMLRNAGPFLLAQDPDHNLIFSVHMYWAVSDGADAAYITAELQAAANLDLPIIVGEFAYKFNRDKACVYECDYRTILSECNRLDIGWLAWEWGPGNDIFDPSCDIMNMTMDSFFNTLKDGWATEVAITSPFGIEATSLTPQYIINHGICPTSDAEASATVASGISLDLYPNPSRGASSVVVRLRRPAVLEITVVDVAGHLVATQSTGLIGEGTHSIQLHALLSLPPGSYSCRVSDGSTVASTRFTILK